MTTQTEKIEKIEEITRKITAIKDCKFASFTYLAKSTGELARFTVNLGFSYHELVKKSVTELEILMVENENVWNPLQKQAAVEVMKSLHKTLEAHSKGAQSDDYTKKGQYIPLSTGVNLNITDSTLQLFVLVNSKVVLTEGVYKTVNSAPLTVEKNKIRKLLPVSNFREFALDVGQLEGAKISGEVFEFPEV